MIEHHYLSNSYLAGLMTLIIFIIVILIWGVLSGFTFGNHSSSIISDTPTILTIDNQIGASTNGTFTLSDDGDFYTDSVSCKSAINTQWSHIRCGCINPYFGSKCTREGYDINYFAVGNPSGLDIDVNVLNTPQADNLSFSQNGISCTKLCDADDECSGVIWNSSCTLLTGDVIVTPGSSIPYSSSIDSTLYLKGNDNALVFTDRVFIYTGQTLPARYYLRDGLYSDNQGNMMPIFENTIVKLVFFPRRQLNSSNLYGVYSDKELTPAILSQVSSGMSPNGVIIISPNDIDLPPFTSKNLWVAYVLINE